MQVDSPENSLTTERVVLLGRLSSMPQREAEAHIREAGGVVLPQLDGLATLAVVGEDGPSPAEWLKRDNFADPTVRDALASGSLRIVRESELWQRLGILEDDQCIQRLYTPAMLAELVSVPVATIRRWKRSGLLTPVREVQRLAFFDFAELAAARRLAELAAAGCSLRQLKRSVERLSEAVRGIDRPLATLPLVVEGRQLLIREGDDLIEPGGQLRLDFEAAEEAQEGEEIPPTVARCDLVASPATPEEMLVAAAELEDAGQLKDAANMYRAVLAATGPNAEVNFLLADVLYAEGDLSAARERYHAAIEIEEDFVEPRANLGCVLAELGELELAVATFRGTLACFADFADVHLHLARTLDMLGRRDEAEPHWRAFLRLSPESPWADEAHDRLADY